MCTTQVRGITQLASALAHLASSQPGQATDISHSPSQPPSGGFGLSRLSQLGAASPSAVITAVESTLTPLLPSQLSQPVSQLSQQARAAAEVLTWLAVELQALPPAARSQALALPADLASRVSGVELSHAHLLLVRVSEGTVREALSQLQESYGGRMRWLSHWTWFQE